MKKVLLVITVFCLLMTAILLVAAEQKYEGVTIRVIAEQQNPTLAMQKQIPKFEEITGINVELEIGPMDNVVGKEMLALESGTGAYDLISIPYQFLGQLVKNGYLQPLDPLLNRKDLKLEDFDKSDLISGMVAASGEWKGVSYGTGKLDSVSRYS